MGDKKCYHDLANHIILVAAQDYYRALVVNDTVSIMALENFFFSEWFSILSDLDPEYLVNGIKKSFRSKKRVATTRGTYERRIKDYFEGS